MFRIKVYKDGWYRGMYWFDLEDEYSPYYEENVEQDAS